MTSTSDRTGYCQRCGCANGNHMFGKCQGKDKKKDKKGFKWKDCDFEWTRCTTSAHFSDIQYIDCFRCGRHPGAPPQHFWGTQPDDEPSVPTADEAGLPWPENEAATSSHEAATSSHEAGPSKTGHGRTLSAESIDPLQWNEEKLQQEFGRFQIEDKKTVSSKDLIHVETYYKKGDDRYIYFIHPTTGKECDTTRGEWISVEIEYEGQPVYGFVYTSRSGNKYGTWELGSGKGKGKGKGGRRH